MNKRSLFAPMLAALLLLSWQAAAAQDGCTVKVVPGGVLLSGCTVVTATPTRAATRTPAPTATRTPTRTPVASAIPNVVL